MTAKVAAIIPAAGLGTRLRADAGAGPPKALVLLAGRTLLQRSVDSLAPYVDEIVVALPPDSVSTTRFHIPGVRVIVVPGGATRQESVSNALAALSHSVALVLVHDAARALVPADVVRRVIAALEGGATCVVPVIAAADSLRTVTADGANAPLDRTAVRLVQTPQGFEVGALRRGHRAARSGEASDDATLVEATGEPVTLVDGDPMAFKITHRLDLLLAEAVLRPEWRS